MIRSVTTHKGVWKWVAGTEEYRGFVIPDGDWFSLVRDGAKVGFIAVLPEDGFKSIHIAVLPEHRGAWVVDAVHKVLEQVEGKVKARVRHRRAYALAVRAGFRKTGIDAGEWIDMEWTK